MTPGTTCPKCNQGQLKERTGPHGQFLGCSKYPNCKYTFTEKKGGFPELKPQNSNEHIELMNFVGTEFANLNNRFTEMARYLKKHLEKDVEVKNPQEVDVKNIPFG